MERRTFLDIGIVGLGLWEGERIGNQRFAQNYEAKAQVKDPFLGRKAEDGTIRIAGMEFHPERHARTVAALMAAFTDPYRGTVYRRYFPDDLKVSEAETVAARAALADAGVAVEEIGAVLCQSFLPDEIQPKNAALIAYNLGIFDAPAWEVDSICNSAITQSHVGASLIQSGQAKYVLCVQSVTYSRVTDPSVSSTIQEGDLASAFVLGPQRGTRMAFSWRTDGRLHSAIRLGWAAPASTKPRRYWEAAPEKLLIRFNEELQPQVMGELAEHAQRVCGEALSLAGMDKDQLDLFVSHQPVSWYGAFIDDVLGLKDGISVNTFREYGNVSSASIPASLLEARRLGQFGNGKTALLFSPATGYTYGALVLDRGRG